MRRNPKFMVSTVAGDHFLIPLGKAATNFNKMIRLNEMGVFIWDLLESETSVENIVTCILNQYDATEEQVTGDVTSFLEVLRKAGCLYEEESSK